MKKIITLAPETEDYPSIILEAETQQDVSKQLVDLKQDPEKWFVVECCCDFCTEDMRYDEIDDHKCRPEDIDEETSESASDGCFWGGSK